MSANWQQYVWVAWVAKSVPAPNLSTADQLDAILASPVPELKPMSLVGKLAVTTYTGGVSTGSGLNVAWTTPPTPQTFQVYNYADPATPDPHKALSVAVLRNSYPSSQAVDGLLVKGFIAFDTNSSGSDPYYDALLAQWSAEGAIEVLEELWLAPSALLTPAELAVQIA